MGRGTVDRSPGSRARLPAAGTYQVDVLFPSGIKASGSYRNGKVVTIVESR